MRYGHGKRRVSIGELGGAVLFQRRSPCRSGPTFNNAEMYNPSII